MAGSVGEGSSAGNPVSVTVSGSGSAAVYGDWTWARTNVTITNGNNAYTAIAGDNLGRSSTNTINCYLPSTISYQYDLNGNLTNDGYRTFTYNDENQLVSVVVSNGITTSTLTSNIYDGKMRRRIRKDYIWESGTSAWAQTAEVHYIYDGNVVIQERNSSNLPMVSYTRGRDLSGTTQGAGGIGGLLARSDNSQLTIPVLQSPHSYYHADGNGNITALISTQQYFLAKYEYDPYGNITAQSGSLADANTYRFSSKEFDKNNGLIYYLYRFYDPNFQRWVNRDPITEPGFEIIRRLASKRPHVVELLEGPNLYDFVFNSPANLIDLFGNGAGNAGHPFNFACDCEKKGGKWMTYGEAFYGSEDACLEDLEGLEQPKFLGIGIVGVSSTGSTIAAAAGFGTASTVLGYPGAILGSWDLGVWTQAHSRCDTSACYKNKKEL